MYKDLTNEQLSYLYGLFITDGFLIIKKKTDNHIYYTLGIELQEKDKDILEKIHQLLPEGHVYQRTRNTNFKNNYTCYSFYYLKQDFPLWLIQNGFPLENKTENAIPPIWEYDENAFWRGVIDGDGSLGIRKCGTKIGTEPYISLTTKSDQLKLAYHNYILKITGFNEKNKRNKRDNVYNIVLAKSRCWKICNELYKNDSIHLNRKYNKYLEILEWRKQYE